MFRAEEKIKQLIDNLDMRKDEAIERTFRVRRRYMGCFASFPQKNTAAPGTSKFDEGNAIDSLRIRPFLVRNFVACEGFW